MGKYNTRKEAIIQAKAWQKAQAESGINKKQWCDENNVPKWKFFRYMSLLKNVEANNNSILAINNNESDNPVFVDITSSLHKSVPSSYSTAVIPSSPIVISYKDFSIDISSGVDEGLLSSVIRAIANAY